MYPFVHLSIVFWLYAALQCWSSMSSNSLVFHIAGGNSSNSAAFLYLMFLNTESSFSGVNCPSFMSNCLLIILVIVSRVTFGGFPSKFSKITNFDYPSNSWRCTCKRSRDNNIICRFLQRLWLHTQREDGANIPHLQPTQGNRRTHNYAKL